MLKWISKGSFCSSKGPTYICCLIRKSYKNTSLLTTTMAPMFLNSIFWYLYISLSGFFLIFEIIHWTKKDIFSSFPHQFLVLTISSVKFKNDLLALWYPKVKQKNIQYILEGGVSIRSFYGPSRIGLKNIYILKQCLSYPNLIIITVLHYFRSRDT